ncbi:sensor histidine kinase [Pseudomonas eucalypticola]|uniref:histidine kinase n=1 Tax=Pseudomonas eucalypticola TaxID=2599595 RepID=A0A7D5H4R9_9PSED|nr:sensor histidine kinase [Pseudomonas eucalypticola]QKZ07645.1 sensor histidine kinase [Pseudomonas eucalypticola]
MYASFRKYVQSPWSMQHMRWLTVLLCLFSLVGNAQAFISGASMSAVLLLLNIAAMLSVIAQHRCAQKSIAFKPQELASRLLEVQENERHRLSRELHDDIGQLLTAAKMQTEWLQRRMNDDLENDFATLRDTIDETLTKVRDVSAILNPRQLNSLGLGASLRAHLLRTLANTDVHWSLECHQQMTGIPEAMAVAAFRITQEAVTNLLRHAQAANLLVRLARTPEGLHLYISDDGVGFTPVADPAAEGLRGMSGMHERAALIGGWLKVTSQPGQGTELEALFPWAPRALERANLGKGL